jgi:hypothetical protein
MIMDFLDHIKQGPDGPNKMPESFFMQFPEKMMERVRWEEELKTVAPLLVTISRKPVFMLPEGYFNSFSVKRNTDKAKIVGMPGWRKLISYAAAAAVAGILVTGAFLFTDNKPVVSFDLATYNKIDVSAELNKLPEEALQQYLATNTVGGAGHELNTEIDVPEASGNVESLSDDELMNYLNEAGEKPETK